MGHAGAHDRRSHAHRDPDLPVVRGRLRPRDHVAREQIVRVRGDREDVFSHGFICPKGSTLKQLHEDPDRLRRPLVKRDGECVEVTWEEAFAEIERRLVPIIDGPRA